MPASRTAARGNSAARNEVISMLTDDHKRVKKAFRDFERIDAHEDQDEAKALVEQCCAELTVHATLEEEVFYPAVREVLREEDLIDEAEVEHQSARSLIEQLQQMSADDPKYAATFTVLGEYVKHHVKEEESEIFPQLARAKLDWEGLREQMTSRREQLMGQLMPEPA